MLLTGPRSPRHRATSQNPWRAGWQLRSWRRRFAGWAAVAVVGDALTTAAAPHVDGVAEANPLVDAAHGLLGSVVGYQALVVVVLLPLMSALAIRPRTAVQAAAWGAVALVGAAKIGVVLWNLGQLQVAGAAAVALYR